MTVFCGPSGSGKIVAGARHDLRRGPAALRRVAVQLRPPVPRAGAEAEGRARHRPVAGHQHRAEDDEQEPALDGRHRHRGLRLPAHPLRPARPAALPAAAASRSARRRPTRSSSKVLSLPEGTKLYMHGPAGAEGAGEVRRRCSTRSAGPGYVRMRVDGKSYSIDEPPAIDHRRKHAVEVVVDRNVVRAGHADADRRGGRAGAGPGPRRHARRPRRCGRGRAEVEGRALSASTSPASTAAAASSR